MLNPYVKEMLLPVKRFSLDIMFRVSSCRPGAKHTVPIAYSLGDGRWQDTEGKIFLHEDLAGSGYREEVYTETDFGDVWKPGTLIKPRYAARRVMTPFDRRSTLRWLKNIDKAEEWVQCLLFTALMVTAPEGDARLAQARAAQVNVLEWMADTASIQKTVSLSDEATIGPLEVWIVGMRLSYYQKYSKMQNLMKLDLGQKELVELCKSRIPKVMDYMDF